MCGLVVILFTLMAPIGHAAPASQPAHHAQVAQTSHQGTSVAGNGSSSSGKGEALLVAEVVLLLLVGRVLGEVMQRFGQPALMGNLLAGLVLGPSLFGLIWPEAQKFIFPSDPAQKGMIDGLSQIGILMLLLLTGMETDVKLVSRMKGAAMAISLSRHRGSFRLRLRFGPDAAGSRFCPTWRADGWCRRCSWARRCPSPRSRSWRWWCAK